MRHRGCDRLRHFGDNGMARGRTGVAEQYGIRRKTERLVKDFVRRHRPEFGVDQPDLVAVVDQGTPDGEQAERWQVIVGNSAAD